MTASTAPLWTRPFVLVPTASLVYFVADGIAFGVLSRYVEGPLAGGEAGAGLAFGAFSFTALILRPFAGRVADRRGRRILMLTGAALFSAAALGHLVATSLPILVGLRLAWEWRRLSSSWRRSPPWQTLPPRAGKGRPSPTTA